MILIRHGQTEFNVVYGMTRRDPGIRDPGLTETGRRQAADAAAALAKLPGGGGVREIVASPYIRALETAEIITEALGGGVKLTVDPLVGERVAFSCDIGSPCADLKVRWPSLVLDHLSDPWWPEPEESEAAILHRAETFAARHAARDDHDGVVVVSHWGFILGMTGLSATNGAVIRVDPRRPRETATPLLMPPRVAELIAAASSPAVPAP
jgi:broad specificity phosphatase PhoE